MFYRDPGVRDSTRAAIAAAIGQNPPNFVNFNYLQFNGPAWVPPGLRLDPPELRLRAARARPACTLCRSAASWEGRGPARRGVARRGRQGSGVRKRALRRGAARRGGPEQGVPLNTMLRK